MAEEHAVALPVQLIEVPQGVILKRGLEELLISGASAAAAAARVLAEAGSTDGSRLADLRELVDQTWPDVDSGALIEQLRRKRMLVESADRPAGPETPEQLLAWNAGTSPRAVAEALQQVAIEVVGVNTVSGRLVESLSAVGAAVRVVDHPEFRNVRLFTADERLARERWSGPQPEAYEAWEQSVPSAAAVCLVVCSDFGGLQALAEWNALAFARGWNFLPAVLQNAVGLVGPFVVPGETACFQCLLERENANSETAALRRATEIFAFEGQPIAAYHPSMASALGDVAAIELTKHYGYGWPSAAIDNAIELNLLTASMKTRPILKVPGCAVCSSLNVRGRVEASRAHP